MSTFIRIFSFALTIPFAVGTLFAEPEDLFETKIAPLLEEKCLSCHNPKDAKGGLTLNTAIGFWKGGDSGTIAVTGDAESSYVLDLITPHDGKAEMPKGADPLTQAEIESLRTWINAGAHWPESRTLEAEKWWSLKPLVQPLVPSGVEVTRVDGQPFEIRTPIDAFIAQTYREKHLLPVAQADRRTLIRRVYSDLIGLPPTPEEIEAFVNNSADDAYVQLVDRLMASPQYGERQAQHWLDVVKYADTCGYDKDQPRPNAWPYRDYVIRSLNSDKNYSQFVKEQIAGDILYPGQPDGIIGLGFIAAGPWDLIGHIEVAEDKIDGKIARMLDRDDMVCSVMNTFTSMTVQCARCHDHKFDPISQAQYFGLQSVFGAVDRAERTYGIDPETQQKKQVLESQLAAIDQQQADIRNDIENSNGGQFKILEQRLSELRSKNRPVTLDQRYGYHSEIAEDQQSLKWVQVDLQAPQRIQKIVMRPCFDDYNQIGAGFGFPVRYRILAAASADDFENSESYTTLVDRTQTDTPNPAFSPVEFIVNAEEFRFVRIEATKLGLRDNDFIFSLAELEIISPEGENLALGTSVQSLDSIEAPERWSSSNLTDGMYMQAADSELNLEFVATQAKLTQLHEELFTPERQALLNDLQQQRVERQTQLNQLPEGLKVFAASTQFPTQGNFHATNGTPRDIYVLNRGEVQSPGELAVPGALPVIDHVPAEFALTHPENEAERRAALAEWITRHDNPLTWRSIVNRIWQARFSNGLVTSPNDFGRMGQTPTHPELLNWLAAEFRDHGQSAKALHRLILLSSVYQLSSENAEANLQADGSNQFLWRMNRRRLDAEEIRDATLAITNQLSLQMGGPGYYLFVIEKPEHSPHYQYRLFDPNEESSHRRSIYRFVVRSQPDPYLTTLDCADSTQSTPQRTETVTALQSLALMNSRFNLVMSERFAARLAEEFTELPSQIERGFELATGRSATAEEQSELLAYASEHGLTNLCRILLNLNEFVYVD